MNRHLRMFFFLTLIITGLQYSFAQETDNNKSSNSKDTKVLTVSDAVKLAKANNISIKESQITVNTKKRAKDHSWNSISPSLSVVGGATSPNDKDTYNYNYEGYMEATVSFSFSPSLFSSMKTAELNYESGLISYDSACRSVELSVRTAFYGLLYEKEDIALEKRNLDTAKKQYEVNLEKYKNGSVSQLDVLSSQVSYEELKPTLKSAQVTWENDMASFKQLIGYSQDQSVELSGSLEDAADFKTISQDDIVSQSLSVKAAEKNLEIEKATLAADRLSAYGPSLSASWTYYPAVTDKSSEPTDSGALSVYVTIPLSSYLPWSSDADTIADAKDSVKNLELELADEKTNVKIETQSYLRQINQELSSIKSLRANIDLAKKTYTMTKEAYNLGTKDLLDLQDASDSLLSAQVSLQSEFYTLISAVLNLENTIGVPFGTLGK